MFNKLFLVLFIVLSTFSLDAYAAGIGPSGGLDETGGTFNSSNDDVEFMVARFYCDVRGVISGTLGTLIGLLISLVGLYTYLMKRSGYGFFFFIAGVALTGLPGIFDWYFRGVVVAFGDADIESRKDYAGEVQTLDSWCETAPDIGKNPEAAPSDVSKSVDEQAIKGEGLYTIRTGNSVSIENIVIDENGDPTGTSFQLK